eukprot:TRINITY_DN4327_c0_g2_i1.p1 TRINITY_DN4327_c0_g2~~TRINITY_DN4327_c0_g2_i1.p1  ORF type:complete len:342 (+),score=110.16 TRINITY_DN4327_c0_g2_i1:87-1028(+)
MRKVLLLGAAAAVAVAAGVQFARQPLTLVPESATKQYIFGELPLGIPNASIIADAASSETNRLLGPGSLWTDITSPEHAKRGLKVGATRLEGDLGATGILAVRASGVVHNISGRDLFDILGDPGTVVKAFGPTITTVPVPGTHLSRLTWVGERRRLYAERVRLPMPIPGMKPREFLFLAGSDAGEGIVFRKSVTYAGRFPDEDLAQRARATILLKVDRAKKMGDARLRVALWFDLRGMVPSFVMNWLAVRSDVFNTFWDRLSAEVNEMEVEEVEEESTEGRGSRDESKWEEQERKRKAKLENHPARPHPSIPL